MKKYIKSSSGYNKVEIMSSEDGLYTLYEEEGVGRNDTRYTGLIVESFGTAYDNVIEIRPIAKNSPEFNGGKVKYEYSGCYISHGMNGHTDTLEETEQYISDLQSAVKFAKRINNYIRDAWTRIF